MLGLLAVCTKFALLIARQRDYLLGAREMSALLVVFTSKMLALLPIFASQKSTYLEDFHVRGTSKGKTTRNSALVPPFPRVRAISAGSSPWRPSSAAGPPTRVSITGLLFRPIMVSRFVVRRAASVSSFRRHIDFRGASALVRQRRPRPWRASSAAAPPPLVSITG